MLTTGKNLGLLDNGNYAEQSYFEMLRLMRGLDTLVQPHVMSLTTATPPSEPGEGDAYIVAAGATGVWVGKDNLIARWTARSAAITPQWEFYTPKKNWVFGVDDDDAIPFVDESPGVGFLFPYCYITERQVFGYSGNAVEAEDWELPEMNKVWHHLVCDYAISRIEIRWNPQGAGAREDRVLRALSAAGANLKYAQEQG